MINDLKMMAAPEGTEAHNYRTTGGAGIDLILYAAASFGPTKSNEAELRSLSVAFIRPAPISNPKSPLPLRASDRLYGLLKAL